MVGKTYDKQVVRRIDSWAQDVAVVIAPFTSPYVVELLVSDEEDESGQPYTNVLGRLVDIVDGDELARLNLQDFGAGEPRILSGTSGVFTSIPNRSEASQLHATFDDVRATSLTGRILRPGDADQDNDFDQQDLVQVLQGAKYLTGQPATWGEGDWDGAPGGEPGDPPAGNGMFDQLDVIAALGAGTYLAGPYAAVLLDVLHGDGPTSVGYDTSTGAVAIDVPARVELTLIDIDSAAGIFTGNAVQNLGGSFDHAADGNIFKATFGSSFGSIGFGNVARAGLSEESVLGDLTVV